jgi:hypothetical protein
VTWLDATSVTQLNEIKRNLPIDPARFARPKP